MRHLKCKEACLVWKQFEVEQRLPFMSRPGPLFVHETTIGVGFWSGKRRVLETLPFFTRVELIHYLRLLQQDSKINEADNSRQADHILTRMLVCTLISDLKIQAMPRFLTQDEIVSCWYRCHYEVQL